MRRDRTQISAWQGLRGGGNGEKLPNGCGVWYWGPINVWELDRGRWWLHDSECTNGHWVIYFKMVGIMLCEFHLNNFEF